MSAQQYQKSIAACLSCASVCNHCAVSCLEEKSVASLTKCIRLNLECSVICQSVADLISLNSRYLREICQLCAAMCNACAEECEIHAAKGMEHCKECAETCRTCVREVMKIYQNLNAPGGESGGPTPVHQDECEVISRAAAGLMSLRSAYCHEICQLNATICNAAAKDLEKNLNMDITHSRECALISNEIHEHLNNPDQEKGKVNVAASKNDEPSVRKEDIEKQKKHTSDLLAASLRRRATIQRHPYISNPFWSGYQ